MQSAKASAGIVRGVITGIVDCASRTSQARRPLSRAQSSRGQPQRHPGA
jgi:hypothetical protein